MNQHGTEHLRVGEEADLAVPDRKPFAHPANEIGASRVRQA
ncbi:MAG: hypothetical protein ACRDPH_12720 [Marmoricola sp.]